MDGGAPDSMRSSSSDSEHLVNRAAEGDLQVREELLTHYQGRLRRMVAARIDHRLAARVDPSDVVQEVLIDAAGGLDDYLRNRPLPFYVWLRQFARERLHKLHRRHIGAQRRSVAREEPWFDFLGGIGARAGRSTPGQRQQPQPPLGQGRASRTAAVCPRPTSRARSRDPVDADFEQLSVAEAAAALGISAGAVKVRHLRALQRLRDRLDDEV